MAPPGAPQRAAQANGKSFALGAAMDGASPRDNAHARVKAIRSRGAKSAPPQSAFAKGLAEGAGVQRRRREAP